MSYILDALRQSERLRHAGRVPSHATILTPAPKARWRIWPWVLAGALILNAIAWFVQRPLTRDTSALETVASNSAQVDKNGVEEAVMSAPASSETASDAQTPAAVDHGELSGAAVAPRIVRDEPERPDTGRESATQTPRIRFGSKRSTRLQIDKQLREPTDPFASASADATGREPLRPATEELATELAALASQLPAGSTQATGTRKEGRAVTPTRPSVPLLRVMPTTFRDVLPTMRVDALLYDAEPAKRVVVINGRRYFQGELVEAKVELQEITRRGVVLRYLGKRFMLPQFP